MTRDIELDYSPREQFLEFHARKQRWAILVCHRRAGKTVATINDMVARALSCKLPSPRLAFLFPQRNQAKDTAWKYLRQYSQPAWSAEPYENELRVELVNGASIRLYGADNPDALRGPYLDGVVLDEFAQMKPDVWSEVIRPQLSDRKGWATFIGTPKGKNEFYKMYQDAQKDPEWFHMIMRASESGLISDEEMASLVHEYAGRPDQYAQEFECQWEAAIKGAFYADEMRLMLGEGRITPIEINKNVRVHTSWDLGVSDSTAICFWQAIGRERHLVDYYEASGVGLDHYAQVLHDKRRQHEWQYGDHFFPHDVTQRELSTGKSRVSVLAGLGVEATIVPNSNVLDGISAVRRMLGRTWIDENRCERLIEALRGYRRDWIDKLKDWSKDPLHDWTSHGADACRYFAVGFDDSSVAKDKKPRAPEPPKGSHWSA